MRERKRCGELEDTKAWYLHIIWLKKDRDEDDKAQALLDPKKRAEELDN